MVLAAFSYRDDAHLVPGQIEKIRPAVHGYVAWDDRKADAALSDEPPRLPDRQGARTGGKLAFDPDPDERIEAGLADWLPDLLAGGDRTLWLFHRREMFDAGHYPSHGLWGAKTTLCLFPIAAAGPAMDVALHGK